MAHMRQPDQDLRMLQGYFWPLSVWKRIKGGQPPTKEHPIQAMAFQVGLGFRV